MKKVVGLTLSLLLIFVCALAVAEDPIAINKTTFPDDVFRKYVQINFDIDGNNELSTEEIDQATTIKLDSTESQLGKVKSLEGIQFFTNLKTLDCFHNDLTGIDLSKNLNLSELWCSYNPLGSLDVRNNTKLVILSCYDTKLTDLNVSKNTNLQELYCGANPLSSLDVSKNTKLTILYCMNDGLKKLDLQRNAALTELWCFGNNLNSLNLKKNTKLIRLRCNGNSFSKLDISKQTALKKLVKNSEAKVHEKYQYGWWTLDKEGELDQYLFVNDSVEIITKSGDDVAINDIILNESKKTLTRTIKAKKPTLQLKAEVLPEDATDKTLEWTSSNPKVAKVDQTGKVTGLKPGKAVITCKAMDDSGVSAKCEVTVENQLIKQLKLNKKDVTLKKGKTLKLKVTVKPATAISKKVTWSSSDKDIATVDKNGTVKAKGSGSCFIICTAADSGKIKVKCKIMVE